MSSENRISYRALTYTLGAGAGEDILGEGGYIRFLSATAELEIGIDGSTPAPLPVAVGVLVPSGFEKIRVENPNPSAVTFQIVISDGMVSDNRLSLTAGDPLPVRGGADNFNIDGAVAMSTVAASILAANATRTSAIIYAGASDLWIGPDNTVTATGPVKIAANGSQLIAHTAQVFGIRAAGADDCGYYEEIT